MKGFFSLSATEAPTPKTIQFDVLFIVDETEDDNFIPDVAEKFIEATMEIFTTSQRRARVGLITMPQKEVERGKRRGDGNGN